MLLHWGKVFVQITDHSLWLTSRTKYSLLIWKWSLAWSFLQVIIHHQILVNLTVICSKLSNLISQNMSRAILLLQKTYSWISILAQWLYRNITTISSGLTLLYLNILYHLHLICPAVRIIYCTTWLLLNFLRLIFIICCLLKIKCLNTLLIARIVIKVWSLFYLLFVWAGWIVRWLILICFVSCVHLLNIYGSILTWEERRLIYCVWILWVQASLKLWLLDYIL